MDWGGCWRAGLVVLCLAACGCVRRPDATYVQAVSPDGRNRAMLLQRYNRLGFSSEFVFTVNEPGFQRSLPILGTRELEWRTGFAAVCWSADSQQVAYMMSNFWEPGVIEKAFDAQSGRPVSFDPFVPMIRRQVEAQFSPFLAPGIDPYQQARRPSQKLISEFTRRVMAANGQ